MPMDKMVKQMEVGRSTLLKEGTEEISPWGFFVNPHYNQLLCQGTRYKAFAIYCRK